MIALLASLAWGVEWKVDDSGVAIGGYDPVSYFRAIPRRGKAELAAEHDGATFYFSNEMNREIFLEDPARYAPAFRGWCAYTVGAESKLMEVDLKTYKIRKGRLLLFANNVAGNHLQKWNEAEDSLTAAADEAWQKIEGKKLKPLKPKAPKK